jgi:hypothetical protein
LCHVLLFNIYSANNMQIPRMYTFSIAVVI